MPKDKRGIGDFARKCMQLVQQRSAQIITTESVMLLYTGIRADSNTMALAMWYKVKENNHVIESNSCSQ